MVTAARKRGIDAHVADATASTFENEFDAYFQCSLHWVKNDPDAAITQPIAHCAAPDVLWVNSADMVALQPSI